MQNHKLLLILIANNIDKKYKALLNVMKLLNKFLMKYFLIFSNLYKSIQYVQFCENLTSFKNIIL